MGRHEESLRDVWTDRKTEDWTDRQTGRQEGTRVRQTDRQTLAAPLCQSEPSLLYTACLSDRKSVV